MQPICFFVFALAGAQTSSSTVAGAEPGHARALQAMEKAAAAAQASAEASARAASAMERIAGVPAAVAEGKPAAAKVPEGWTGNVGFGLIWLSGNSQALTFSGSATGEKKTEDWIFSAKANGVYGQTLPAGGSGPNTVNALAALFMLRGDRRFSKHVTGYLAGGADADHIKSIEIRGTGEAGSGITWLETIEGDLTKNLLRTDVGFRFQRELRFQYFPTPHRIFNADGTEHVTLIAPRLGIAFRHAVSKDLIFTQDAEILPNIVGDSRVLINTTSKLAMRIVGALSFAVGLDLRYDSAPAEVLVNGMSSMPDRTFKKTLDSILTVGLEFAI